MINVFMRHKNIHIFFFKYIQLKFPYFVLGTVSKIRIINRPLKTGSVRARLFATVNAVVYSKRTTY